MRATKGVAVAFVGFLLASGLIPMFPVVAQAKSEVASSPSGRWVSLTTSGLPGPLRQIQFLGPYTAFGVVDGAFYGSIDGGYSWFEISNPGSYGPFFFLDSQHGWMMDTQYGDSPGGRPRVYSILKTTDGGRNWARTVFFDDEDADLLVMNQLVFLDEQTGFLIGSGHKSMATYIWSTGDGGRTWDWYDPEGADWSMDGALACSFLDQDNGWTVAGWETDVGEGSSILHTADGGLSWERQLGSEGWSPTGNHTWYMDVDFVDLQHGWVVGSTGTVLCTADGGTSWEKQFTPTSHELYSVDFIDHLTGWAVGEEGTILFTSDGGHSWATVQCPTSSDLSSVQFTDEKNGWILSSSGQLLKYSATGLVFSDMPGYRDDIYILAREGIVKGYDDGTFRPDNPVLRAQLAKMLVGALGLEVRDGAIRSNFVDVPAGPPSDPLYPDDFVAVAAANGIVQGISSSLFRPYQPVTRIQMVSMVVRALERLRPGRLEKPALDWKSQFPEATDPTHGENVRLAEYNGLLSHWGHSYPWEGLYANLWDPATREEMALILWWALGGELPPIEEPMKSEMTLPELRDHLLRNVQSKSLIYLPTQLPSGWALLKDGCQVWKAGDGYDLAFTNGHSTVYLQWPYEGDGALGGFHHTGVSWEGREIVAGYSDGWFCCFVDGWDHWYWLSGDPWNREVVLALAASMEWMRGTMSPGR